MSFIFGSKEYSKCLLCLGFTPQRQTGSSHRKYKAPQNILITAGRDFIIVIQGKKAYDPHTCSKIIKQLIRLGIKKDDILKCFDRKK
ncbi:hypothetical protein MUP32_05165 [Candidatus Microgenomates bacterium]|nr:hypothetical protein [Candidatus Microgenomates bacterium]